MKVWKRPAVPTVLTEHPPLVARSGASTSGTSLESASTRKEAAEFMRRLREMKVENVDHVIEVNDWVLVELNANDKLNEHHSGCQKYKPKWGLPQRVVEVRNHSALLAPVFTRTPREWQPLTKLRLLHKDIPKQMMSLLPLLIKTSPKIDWQGLHDELPEFLSPEDFFQTPTSGGSVPSYEGHC
eukprot:Blabericola_migrator_1__7468@NODE_3811_length_1492_cov_26_563509_g2000_i3_p1_GENE_NODE_3811_length_1492_cov_26_563509_g2000_i3NODE_3811_length_1492_cov_26_563509_g2000_i3_p1_ORF_typecomplete_len184_score32_23ATPgrasp_3/PF02655_14/0_25_NODE_3811_length_1492_cov_26_563509_g2000_i3155706